MDSECDEATRSTERRAVDGRVGEKMIEEEAAEGQDEASAHRLTTSEVVRMVRGMFEWRCSEKGCKHRLQFPLDQIGAIPFFIVRHMLKDHGMMPDAVVDREPALAREVEEYCREMGVRA